jgi:aspartyl-tRNA(Asn)/glutamyl-tRNA(Gln) amidotransferase subunit A
VDSEPLTITAAAPLIRGGQLTPLDLLEQCLARIDRYEPKVRAWAYLDRERARTEAAQLTDEIRKGHYRGPLHGIPVGVKDIIDVFDMPTGCGSKLWANSYARKDAVCVERLRRAGVLILGKTVTTAYAYLDPPPTRNPWNLERTPGGSSSGSAAAVACGMCLGSLGTQTGGSIVRPASFCGVCALKPTWSCVSVDGVQPLAPSLDHVGLMANCVPDLALLLKPIAYFDRDSVPTPEEFVRKHFPPQPDLPRQLTGLPGYFPDKVSPDMAAAFDQFRSLTSQAGWSWSDRSLPPMFADIPRHHYAMMSVEAARVHADRIARRPDDYPPRIRGLVEDGLRCPAVEYAAAVEHHTRYWEDGEAWFGDPWPTFAVPAASGPAGDPSTTGDPSILSPWSYARVPVVSVPVGRSPDGLPLAVALVRHSHCDGELLKLAAEVESSLGRKPVLPPVS